MKNKSNKEIKVAYILLYVSCAILILLVLLSMKYPASIESFGGSLIFLPVIAGLFVLFYLIKPLALEFSLFALIISGILAINFFGYLEKYDMKIYLKYIYFLSLCIFITFYVFVMSFMRLIKPPDSLDESGRRFRGRLFLIISGSFMIIMPFIVISTVNAKYLFLNKNVLNHSSVNIAFIILALIITLLYLLKVGDGDIKKIIIDEKYRIRYSLIKLKKYFLLIFSSIIIFGSMIEIQRGMWVMWIETILLLVLMSLIIWKIYKHVFISATEQA